MRKISSLNSPDLLQSVSVDARGAFERFYHLYYAQVFRTRYTNPQNGKELTSSIPLFGKYWQDGLTAINQCEINMHILRYADALLMYADPPTGIGFEPRPGTESGLELRKKRITF